MSCDYCEDRAPSDGSYYRCPKCDAEWPEEVIKLKPLKWYKIGDNTFSAQNGLGVFKIYENLIRELVR